MQLTMKIIFKKQFFMQIILIKLENVRKKLFEKLKKVPLFDTKTSFSNDFL